MEFKRCTETEMILALDRANEQYEGNLCFSNAGPDRKRGALQTRLQTKKSGVLGSRTVGRSGKNSRNASWEAHRDFLRELFRINPKASVRTKFAHYNGTEKFEELFPGTAYVNIGSQYEPFTMPDMTWEYEEPKPPIPRAARKPFNALVRAVRTALLPRIVAGEFDDVQHSNLNDATMYAALGKLAVLAELRSYIPYDEAKVLCVRRDWDYVPTLNRFNRNINAAKRYWEENVYEEQS